MASTTFDTLNSSHVSSRRTSGHGPARSHWHGLDGIARRVSAWRARSRERFELAHMTDLDLADIGLSRVDAEAEAVKPFWRA